MELSHDMIPPSLRPKTFSINESDNAEMKNDSRVLTLTRLSDNRLKVYVRQFEEFNYELENSFELRGE